MATAEKGTRENPYTMEECDKMLDDGTWPGGWVKDGDDEPFYVLKEVSMHGCCGYCGCSGSRFEFSTGSTDWHYPDENSGSDDGAGGAVTGGGNSGNTGGNTGGGGGSTGGPTGGNDSDISTINNGKQGTFLYKAKYYTEKEYDQMCKNGTWTGGNVYTLGYIGRDCVVTANLTPVDANDDWLTLLKEKASLVRNYVEETCNAIMSNPYVRAVGRYHSATGKPLYFDAESLGIADLRGCSFKDDTTHINLLEPNNLRVLLANKNFAEQTKILSTALTLGNITLVKKSEGIYTIEPDKYNFDMHPQDELGRNIATVLGYAASEGLSIAIDLATARCIGLVEYQGYVIAAGIIYRNVIKDTSFYIHISGEVKIK